MNRERVVLVMWISDHRKVDKSSVNILYSKQAICYHKNCKWYLALRLAEYSRFYDARRHCSESTEEYMPLRHINSNNGQLFGGVQVKNRLHRGLQGEVVVSAWANLEAGL